MDLDISDKDRNSVELEEFLHGVQDIWKTNGTLWYK